VPHLSTFDPYSLDYVDLQDDVRQIALRVCMASMPLACLHARGDAVKIGRADDAQTE
jgi:hypothetical protein